MFELNRVYKIEAPIIRIDDFTDSEIENLYGSGIKQSKIWCAKIAKEHKLELDRTNKNQLSFYNEEDESRKIIHGKSDHGALKVWTSQSTLWDQRSRLDRNEWTQRMLRYYDTIDYLLIMSSRKLESLRIIEYVFVSSKWAKNNQTGGEINLTDLGFIINE